MQFSELTAFVKGSADNHRAEILHVAHPANASLKCVVFATDARALEDALASGAGAILVSSKLLSGKLLTDARTIAVPDARYAFALVGVSLEVKPHVTEVHPTAVIAEGVSLGVGSRIGPYAVIASGVRLGAGCSVHAHVTIHENVFLGDRVVVQAGAVLGSTGFGYAKDPESDRYVLFPQQGTLVIGDDVDIGANTTIDRGALGETRIGRGTKIDNLVHIGHNCVIGEDVIIAAQTGISGSSVIQDGAILGGQVGIGEHATVGRGVILGGGAGVLSGKKMQGAGQVFWGRPARPLKAYLRGLASFAEAARLRSRGKD